MRLASRCDFTGNFSRDFQRNAQLRAAHRRPALFRPASRDEAGRFREIVIKSAS
jgi:hypothetical protein